MIDFDEIRKQVAIKHNVLLGKDDPILVTVTISEMVLDRYLSMVSDHYEQATKALAFSTQKQVEQAKKTAAKIITDASDYVSDQVRQAVVLALKEAGSELQHQLRNTQAARLDAQIAKKGAFLAALAACVAAAVALSVVFMR